MSPVYRDHSADAARAAMEQLPSAGPPRPGSERTVSGQESARHPAAGATLPIRVEWARQWHRKRTQFALGFMVALPLILAGAFALGSDNSGDATASSFIDLAQSSAANFVMVTLFFSSSFLLIVLTALYFGDTVASEASWSSLKYLLTIPVPRLRLLRQKWIVAALLTLTSVVLLMVVAAVVGLLIYGPGPLTTPVGATLDGGASWGHMAIAVGYCLLALAWVAGLAFLMTVSTDVPLGAVGTAVLISIVSQILDQITALGDLRRYLPTHYATAWVDALSTPIDWADMARGACTSVGYAVILTIAAFVVFRRKDVTS